MLTLDWANSTDIIRHWSVDGQRPQGLTCTWMSECEQSADVLHSDQKLSHGSTWVWQWLRTVLQINILCICMHALNGLHAGRTKHKGSWVNRRAAVAATVVAAAIAAAAAAAAALFHFIPWSADRTNSQRRCFMSTKPQTFSVQQQQQVPVPKNPTSPLTWCDPNPHCGTSPSLVLLTSFLQFYRSSSKT